MADTLKGLYERKGAMAKEIKRQADLVNAESRDFKPEERAAWDKVNADYDALCKQIEPQERAAKIEAELGADEERRRAIGRDPYDGDAEARRLAAAGNDGAKITEETRSAALSAWYRWQMGQTPTAIEEDACKQLRFNPAAPALEIPLFSTHTHRQMREAFDLHRAGTPMLRSSLAQATEKRAGLSAQSGPSGAYTIVPMDLIRSLEINMLYFGCMLQVADIIRTNTGEPMMWPTASDTGNKGRRITENTQVDLTNAVTANPKFGAVLWQAWKYTSDAVLVPYELLEDSVFNLPGVLGEMLGERLGRILNTETTTGTGASQPVGIVTAAVNLSNNVTSSSASAVAADDLISLIHKVDVAYRTADCGFMFHDQTIAAIRKLKDGQGQYLWQSGLQQGVPDKILSYRLGTNNDMAQIGASNVVGVFGQLNKYKIRQVNSVRLYRLQERFRDNDQDGFVAFLRADGNLLQAGTAPVATYTMHS